jgi:hypothetical protein
MEHVDYEGDAVVGVFHSREGGERAARDWFEDSQFAMPSERDANHTEWRSTPDAPIRNHRDRLTLTRWDLQ